MLFMPDIEKLNYAQRQRLQFIESVVYWEGLIGRPRVAAVFGVSDNHITRDFALYRKAFPDNLDYDVSARTYRLGKGFKPRIGSGSPEEYLSLLRTYVETQSTAVLSSIGEGVDAVCLPLPHAPLDNHVLREITRALRQRYGVKIRYQSLTSSEATTRTIWPHALVFAGVRWHVRAYDSKRQKFLDFVPHRMLSAAPVQESCPVEIEADTEWHESLVIDIAPASKLNADQQAVIAKEYGMTQLQRQWVWRVRIKRCLAAYFLNWLRLDLPENKSFPIRLLNPELARLYRFGDE
jgi:predicted DNA-binding transcriptional regulator YafY